MLRVVIAIAGEAQSSDNAKLCLLAVQRFTTLAELLAKLKGELSEGSTQVAIHLTPEFEQMRATLLQILQPHPELRTQIARALLTSGNHVADADR